MNQEMLVLSSRQRQINGAVQDMSYRLSQIIVARIHKDAATVNRLLDELVKKHVEILPAPGGKGMH